MVLPLLLLLLPPPPPPPSPPSPGVPGPPTQPEVVAWGENGVTIATSLPKLGSGIELYLTVTSVLNGSEVTTHSTALSGQVEGRRIEVAVPNVTYHRWLQFQASASNYLGSSRSSSLSLPGGWGRGGEGSVWGGGFLVGWWCDGVVVWQCDGVLGDGVMV